MSNIILTNENTATDGLPNDLSVQDVIYFKYSVITSVDVKHSYAGYKNL